MKLLIYVMNQPDRLDELMQKFADNQVKGATIIEATGMAKFLMASEHPIYIERLSGLIDFKNNQSRIIMSILPDEQVPLVYQIIGTISGDFSLPNSGIAFTIPVDSLRGYKG